MKAHFWIEIGCAAAGKWLRRSAARSTALSRRAISCHPAVAQRCDTANRYSAISSAFHLRALMSLQGSAADVDQGCDGGVVASCRSISCIRCRLSTAAASIRASECCRWQMQAGSRSGACSVTHALRPQERHARRVCPVAGNPAARLLAQMHDELLFEVPEAQVGETAMAVRRVMEGEGRQLMQLSSGTGSMTHMHGGCNCTQRMFAS